MRKRATPGRAHDQGGVRKFVDPKKAVKRPANRPLFGTHLRVIRQEAEPMPSKTRLTWKRLLTRVGILLLLLVTATLAVAPWLFSTPPGRALILSQVNKAIAPGRLEARGLRFSWSGPIVAEGVVLR